MLSELTLRHFATVEQLTLNPQAGLTVVTGETGAGKSIIIDALALALGGRGDSDQVRAGCSRAEFSANFDLADAPSAAEWLMQNDYDDNNSCQLRRTLSADGRSRAWINGRPSTLQEVRALADQLISIHSQHEHQKLLHKDHQRQLLDSFAAAESLVLQVANDWQHWQQAQQQLKTALNKANDHSEREALLRFQLQELDEIAIESGELDTLEAEQKRLTHAEQLLQLCNQSLMLLYEGDNNSIDKQVSHTAQMMADASQQDDSLIPIADAIESARLQLEASAGDLRHYLDGLEQDPERLAWIESRLDSIYSLARKHRVRPEALPEHHQTLQQAAAELGNIDQQLEQLEIAEQQAEQHYLTQATKLSKCRRKEASQLTRLIQTHLTRLGMKGARIEVTLETIKPSAAGLEQVELQFTANPGQPLRALAKVASGGELARVSLAIQAVCAERLTLPCLVFDEVDVGVGGGTAEIVGQLLRQLGQKAQVLCITHQPQVASLGHQHWQVHKKQTTKSTASTIYTLDVDSRVDELARMLGGLEITAATQQHAREMLLQGQQAAIKSA